MEPNYPDPDDGYPLYGVSKVIEAAWPDPNDDNAHAALEALCERMCGDPEEEGHLPALSPQAYMAFVLAALDQNAQVTVRKFLPGDQVQEITLGHELWESAAHLVHAGYNMARENAYLKAALLALGHQLRSEFGDSE